MQPITDAGPLFKKRLVEGHLGCGSSVPREGIDRIVRAAEKRNALLDRLGQSLAKHSKTSSRTRVSHPPRYKE